MQLVSLKKKFTMKRCIHWLMNMTNIFVLLLSQMMINPVLADNDVEYISFNDLELWNAYYYWQLHDLSADNTTSYTNTLNTISQGTATGSFNFSGSFSGSFDANVQLAISGLTSTELDDVDDILSSRTFYYFGQGSDANPLIEMSISSSDQGTEYIPRYSCVYNPSATGASTTMTCTPNTYDGAFTMPDQDIKVTSIDVSMNSLTDYQLTLTLKNENTARGTLSGTLGLSGNGQGTLSLTENGTATTTSINTNSLEYVLPIIKGTVNSTNSYLRRLTIPRDPRDSLVISMLCARPNAIFNQNSITDIVDSSGVHISDIITNYTNQRYGGLSLTTFEFSKETGSSILSNIYWNNTTNVFTMGFIPIYVGLKSHMSDSLYRFIFGQDRTLNELTAFHNDMVSGTTGSQSAASDLSNQQQSFEGATNDMVNLETNTFDGVSDAIGNVNVDNNILIGSGFLNAADWVRVQFDNLTSFPAFNSVLVFSLSLGFALLIIGKVR